MPSAHFIKSFSSQRQLVEIRLGPSRVIVICDPELTRQVLVDDRTFDKGGVLFDRIREVVGNGLATCPHGEHRRQRRLAQPAFHHSRFPGYAKTMTRHIAIATESWQDGEVLDIQSAMLQISMRTLMATMFSDRLPPSALRVASDDICTVIGGVYRRAMTPRPVAGMPTLGGRRFRKACKRLRHTVSETIKERRGSGIDYGDLLSALLSACEPTDGFPAGKDGGLTESELIDQILSFFIAGSETIAEAISFALLLVARHPDIESRLHAEADAVLAGRVAGFDDVPELVLAQRVILESLRLYPPVWMLTRKVTANTKLGAYHIPAGATIVYSPYLVHHHSDAYAEPEIFDPDRWIDERRLGASRSTFIPFGSGARKCIGDQFALMEAVLMLATIAGRWRLQPVGEEDIRVTAGIVLTPHELRMRLAARVTQG